mmetsp:Transcript_2972/g.5802  ORF Transcript_2972/g.5802 Transcript_2972/m.5802 type:complete len:255 (+) Transcript_2972:2-766(+)
MLRNINHTLRERIVLARWTRSPELRASVASLRRTRLKVAAVQLTVIIANAGNVAIQTWLISNSARQLYASYSFAYEYLAYSQIVLLVLQTYTKFEVPTSWQIVQAAGLSRFFRRSRGVEPSNEVEPTGQAMDTPLEREATCQMRVDTMASSISTKTHGALHVLPTESRIDAMAAAESHIAVSVVVEGDSCRPLRDGCDNAENAAGSDAAEQSCSKEHVQLQEVQPQNSEEEEQTHPDRRNNEQPRQQKYRAWDC